MYKFSIAKGSESTFEAGSVVLGGKLPNVGVYWNGFVFIQRKKTNACSNLQVSDLQVCTGRLDILIDHE